jgi:hypothetical protein
LQPSSIEAEFTRQYFTRISRLLHEDKAYVGNALGVSLTGASKDLDAGSQLGIPHEGELPTTYPDPNDGRVMAKSNRRQSYRSTGQRNNRAAAPLGVSITDRAVDQTSQDEIFN